MSEAPKRAIELTLKVSADDWESVAIGLGQLQTEIALYGQLGNGCSGGVSHSDIRTVELRPEMTHE